MGGDGISGGAGGMGVGLGVGLGGGEDGGGEGGGVGGCGGVAPPVRVPCDCVFLHHQRVCCAWRMVRLCPLPPLAAATLVCGIGCEEIGEGDDDDDATDLSMGGSGKDNGFGGRSVRELSLGDIERQVKAAGIRAGR